MPPIVAEVVPVRQFGLCGRYVFQPNASLVFDGSPELVVIGAPDMTLSHDEFVEVRIHRRRRGSNHQTNQFFAIVIHRTQVHAESNVRVVVFGDHEFVPGAAAGQPESTRLLGIALNRKIAQA